MEEKLVKFDEEDIHPLLLRSENYRLLEDERPTKRFLNLENDKAKYNNVSRLQITNVSIDKTTDPPTEIKTTRLTTKPEEILGEFQSKFATIYSKQTGVDGSEESIIDFLNSDGDEVPLQTLQQRKNLITPEEFTCMEGLMSETELTETLTKFMKGASAPGVDGFTVNWLREFWPDLRKLVTNALNEMYGEGILSSMCREAIIRLLRKGEKKTTSSW